MQQLVGLFAVRGADIFLVKGFDRLIVVRKAVGRFQVFVKQAFGAFAADVVGDAARFRLSGQHYPRLSAAGDAAAAAGHDFDKVVGNFLTRRFGCASLVKGGHFVNEANDVLAEPAPLDDEGNHLGDPLTTWFRHKRIETGNTHGTGCTLSSAIACALAQGMDLADAVNAGKAYLTGALAAGFDMGKGSGPVNHMWQY